MMLAPWGLAHAQNASYAAAVQAVQPALVALQAASQSGSGMVVSEGGLVLTNLHVVVGREGLEATLPDGRTFKARVVATAPKLDVALVQLEGASGLKAVQFARSAPLQAGDVVLSVGYPFGGEQSVSVGVVGSPKRRQVLANPFQSFIQTDAALAPGSSGGALITPKGLVVGMVAAIEQGGTKAQGFALPSDTLMAVLNDWRRFGGVQVGWFGAEGRAPTVAEAEKRGMAAVEGMLVTEVLPLSPASNAGLQKGDVLLRVEGLPISNPRQLPQDLGELRTALEAPLKLDLWRDGAPVTLSLKLGNPPPRRSAEQVLMKGYNPLNSVLLEPLSPAVAQELGLPMNTAGALVVRLSPTPLGGYEGKFAVGDVLVRINGQPATTPNMAQGALNTSRRAWEFEFFRDGLLRKMQL